VRRHRENLHALSSEHLRRVFGRMEIDSRPESFAIVRWHYPDVQRFALNRVLVRRAIIGTPGRRNRLRFDDYNIEPSWPAVIVARIAPVLSLR
jgi:hypothetical protein